jgi:MFS family permease
MSDEQAARRSRALRFVVLMGVVSLFADMCYEGMRSAVGPYLGLLGATGAAVGFVGGLGELIGYGLRYVSGRVADRTRAYWALTFFGYATNLIAVPAMALVGSWWAVAGLVALERFGKAVRSPARSTLLSFAAHDLGAGKAFGIHQAMDQIGAVTGPLAVGAILWWRGEDTGAYRWAFAALAIPAILTLVSLAIARGRYREPAALDPTPAAPDAALGRAYRMYLLGVGLIAAGLCDWALLSFHLGGTGVVPMAWLAFVYAAAMAADAIAALVIGPLFDRARARGGTGIGVLAIAALGAAAYAPLIFLGGQTAAFIGVAIWAMALAATDTVGKAVVAQLTPAAGRGRAYGGYYAVFGLAWWLGSAVAGQLYDRSHGAAAGFACACLVAGAAVLALTARNARRPGA